MTPAPPGRTGRTRFVGHPCLRRRLLLALAASVLLPARASAAPALRMVVLLAVSARESLAFYIDLSDYLALDLSVRVLPEVARDFADFYQRLSTGGAHLAFGPPHLMRLLQIDHGWQPLATALPEGSSVLLARTDMPLDKLHGGTVVTLDADALITQAMTRELAHAGLVPGRDYRLLTVRGHDSALRAVDSGMAQAMITRGTGFLAPDARARLKPLLGVEGIPGWIMAAAPRLTDEQRRTIEQATRSFAATPDGRAFLQRHGYTGLQTPSPDDLARLDIYLDVARRIAARH